MSRRRCLWAASCGLAAGVLAVLVPVVGARGEVAYSHVSQFISELGAVGAAYLASAVFPCDAGCPCSGSFAQAVHNLFGFLEYTGAVAGLLLLGPVLRRTPAFRGLATASFLSAALVSVGFGAMLAPGLGPIRGSSQRIAEVSIFAWIAYCSVLLLRVRGGGLRIAE